MNSSMEDSDNEPTKEHRNSDATADRELRSPDNDPRKDSPPALEAFEPFSADPNASTKFAATHANQELAGAVIAGRYKLLQPLGEGGMGTVWLAEQREPVKRRVAIKLIRSGRDSKALLARFDAERQALAVMDHENIARVFDGGLTESGRPYFALELVKGVPITIYCDQTQASVPERLELFTQVCSAVQHAHQKGIIHRDLKPSNIMVTEIDGRPVCKVIDFGLAKAMSGTHMLTDLTLDTAFGAILGTPLYMAPEQLGVSALDVDTRADLYALGVLLYELLTGTTPIERERLKNAAWEEIRRIVHDEEPPTPSTRLSSVDSLPLIAARRHIEPAKLKSIVRGELDWIIMKALEKERNRRYETANALAMDLRRYLAGEPVLAAPPSKVYQFRKLFRRHRTSFLIAGLLFLSLAIGLLGTALGLRTARNAEKSEREAKQAALLDKELAEQRRIDAVASQQQAIRAIGRFGEVIAESPDLRDDPRLNGLRAELLAEPLAFFQQLKDQLDSTADMDHVVAQEMVSTVRAIAKLTEEIGDPSQAEAGHREAIRILERLLEQRPDNRQLMQSLAVSANELGFVLRSQGRNDEALSIYDRAAAIYGQLRVSDPTPELKLGELRVQLNRINVLAGRSNNDAALAELEEVLKWIESQEIQDAELGSVYHSALQTRREMAVDRGDIETAIRYQQRLVDRMRPIVTSEPAKIEAKYQLVTNLRTLGSLAAQNRDSETALRLLEEARELANSVVNRYASTRRFVRELAAVLTDLVQRYDEFDRRAEAESVAQLALPLWERLAEENPTVIQYKLGLANILNRLGSMEYRLGSGSGGRQYFERSETVLSETASALPQLDAEVAQRVRNSLSAAQFNLGQAYSKTDVEKSLEYHNAALKLREQNSAAYPNHPQYRADIAMSMQAVILADPQRWEPAELQSAIHRIEEQWDLLIEEYPNVVAFRHEQARFHNSNVDVLAGLGNHAEVESSYRKAIAIFEWLVTQRPTVMDFKIELGGVLNDLAMLEMQQDQYEVARERLERAIVLQVAVLETWPDSKNARRYLANHYFNMSNIARYHKDDELARRVRHDKIRLHASDKSFADQDHVLDEYELSAISLSNAQRLELSRRAYNTGRYLLSVTILAPTLQADAISRNARARVVLEALESAVLAAHDEGAAPFASALPKEKLLTEAAQWAMKDLDYWERVIPELIEVDHGRLVKFFDERRQSRELTWVRDSPHLELLNDEQRQAWEQVWQRQDQLRSQLLDTQSP